jgi:hypothetical protein
MTVSAYLKQLAKGLLVWAGIFAACWAVWS